MMFDPLASAACPTGAMIVFSHANSYCASTYRRLFDGWRAAGHEVAAIEHFGHDAQFPVDRRWQGMTQQLTTLIDSLPQPRVWLVGHSMGGYLSLLAAGQRPRACAASCCSIRPSSTAGSPA
jgi:pimeloyl-ACP methyl ester carboxylesterase